MQVADYSVFDSLKSWMSEEVSGKERPGLYFTSFHVLYKFGAGERSMITHDNKKSKP
jgi:hypothetical protein